MIRRLDCQSFLLVLSLGGGLLSTAADGADTPAADRKPAEAVDFARDVLPILKARCIECHGAEEPESGLHLLSKAALLRGGDSGEPAVIVGKSSESYLLKVVSGDEPDVRMPPEGALLTKDEIARLKRWIDQGLAMPGFDGDNGRPTTDHWSFQPVKRPRIPVSEDGVIRLPIDAFILRKLTENGLQPSPRAERRTLIRRLFLVMHGLPPSPEQIDAFVADDSVAAWPRLVDEVLDSPRYGERWAQHWLDLIRFGETHGFETNRERPNAWHFRDWVIDALNSDKPYDDFIREQIAGDALGEPIATGYLVAGPHDLVKSPDINLTLMQRQDELSDLINTTGTAFLGLTLGCARCHNHKFDPVTQTDFYSIQAVFAGVQHNDRPLPLTPDQKQRLTEVEMSIARLKQQLAPFIPPAGTPGSRREAVRVEQNVDRFPPIKARFVRFTIEATNTGSQPCIDELEVFTGERNVALASLGAKATASSTLPGYDIHKLEHINDGRYGNARSWISNEAGKGWVQIELPRIFEIDRVEWARDRELKYRDRLATKYRVEIAVEPDQWQLVASSEDRLPFGDTKTEFPAYHFELVESELAEQGRRWLAQLEAAQKERERLAETQKVYAGTFTQPGPTHRLYRGEPTAKREEVSPDALAVISSLGLDGNAPEQQRRLKFAEWVASADNPLTARVIVNRLWQFHFGTGIVATPSDFGKNGVPPTHPELLDWLASELVGSGWSLKHIHRLILLSQTWQQDSYPNEKSRRVDGATSLLWRFPPRRLEAEAIRDCILSVTAQLNLQMSGPGFSGFEVEMENVRHFHPRSTYGPEEFRRMIYMTKVRQERESVFGLFDCPDASQVVAARSRSTTPLQALNLLNSGFVMQQSNDFAKRLKHDVGTEVANQVRLAFRLTFGREPSPLELEDSMTFIGQTGLPEFCRALLNSNEFLFIQ
ncbi:DUF1553 domain-containing protein [bacterium]|nr:DUF1553 domain-containing protein [bacterium]